MCALLKLFEHSSKHWEALSRENWTGQLKWRSKTSFKTIGDKEIGFNSEQTTGGRGFRNRSKLSENQ